MYNGQGGPGIAGGMRNWPAIGVYRGWGARRDSGAAVRELERGRLRKLLGVTAELLRGSSGAGMPQGSVAAVEQRLYSGGAVGRGVFRVRGGAWGGWVQGEARAPICRAAANLGVRARGGKPA